MPSPSFDHSDSELYEPLRAAYACAAASMARTSCPVAQATAAHPFIIPLLCVTALYTSSRASLYARIIESTAPGPPTASAAKTAVARAVLTVE